MNVTEAERYNKAWITEQYAPLIGLLYVRCLYRTYFFRGYKNLLDVGCGSGAAVRYHREIGGIETYGIDFASGAMPTWKDYEVNDYCAVASADGIPFKDNSFDMVTCTDMLEHVPEKDVKKVLNEMLRVGRGDFFFTVALTPAQHKMPHDGSEPHVCLKPPEWWLEIMGKIGYRFTAMPHTGGYTLFAQARKRNAHQH